MTDIEVVRAIYDAMAGADIEGLLALVDPACVITQDDRLPWGGRHVGHDGLGTFVTALLGNIASKVEIEALYEADGEVIQFGHTRGTVVATGVPFDIAEVHRWVVRDGKAVTAHFAIDTPGMLAALAATA